MRRLRWILNAAVLLLPMLTLAVGGYIRVRSVFDFLNTGARLAGVASAEATRALGREVRVEDVHFTGVFSYTALNRIELRGVHVANGLTLRQGELYRIDRVVLSYRFGDIFYPPTPSMPYVEKLELYRPYGLVARAADGTWNFSQFITKKGKAGRAFLDRVSIYNGDVIYDDKRFPHVALLPGAPLRIELRGINAAAVIQRDGMVNFSGAAWCPDGRIGAVQANGFAGRLGVVVHARAADVSGPAIIDRLLPPNVGRIYAGRGSADVTVTWLPVRGAPGTNPANAAKKVDVYGTAQVRDLAARFRAVGAPIAHTTGAVQFDLDGVTGDIRGRIAGADLHINGTLLNFRGHLIKGAPQPTIAIYGSLIHSDISRFYRELRIAQRMPGLSPGVRELLSGAVGPGNVTFRVVGNQSQPTITAVAQFNAVRTGPAILRNVQMRLVSRGAQIASDIRSRAAGGDISARLQLTPGKSFSLIGEVHGRSVQLGDLHLNLKPALRGETDFDVGLQLGLGAPRMNARIRVADIQAGRYHMASAYGAVHTDKNGLFLDALRVDDPRGFVMAHGNVTLDSADLKRSTMRLHVDADDLNLASLAQEAAPRKPPLVTAGDAYLRGTLTGAVNNPKLSGRLTAFGIMTHGIDIDTAESDFDLSRDFLILPRIVVRRYPSSVHLAGTLTDPFSSNAYLTISGTARNMDIPEALRLAKVSTGGLSVTGSAAADVRADGPLDALRATADNITLRDTAVGGLALDNAGGRVDFSGGVFHVTDAHTNVAGGTAHLTGSIGSDGAVALHAALSDINLGALSDAMPELHTAQLAGIGNVTADIGGTTAKPEVSGNVKLSQMSAYSVPIGTFSTDLLMRGRRVTAENASLVSPDNGTAGLLTATGLEYDLDNKTIGGTLQLKDLPIQRLRDSLVSASFPARAGLLNALPTSISGTLGMNITLSGALNDPTADVQLTSSPIIVNNQTITSIAGSARLTRDSVVIPSPLTPKQIVHMDSPDASVDALGRLDFGGAILADVSAYNVGMGFLQGFLPPSALKPVGGVADVFVVASGESRSPVLDVSVNLRDLTYLGQKLDRMDISHAHIAEGAVTADQITLLRREPTAAGTMDYHGTAGGTIGFTWKAPFIPADAKLDFHADVPKQSLQFFSAFAPSLLKNTTGDFSARFTAKGTRSDPVIIGGIDVTSPHFQVAGLTTGLSDVDAGFEFQGDHLTVTRFTGHTQGYNLKTGASIPALTGSPITLTGSLPLTGASQPRDGLELRAEKVVIAEKPLPYIGSGSATGTADVLLRVEGSLMRPEVSGAVTLRDAQLLLPRDFGGAGGGGFFLPVNPKLNLRLRLADRVRIVNSQINARTSGDIVLTGTALAPRMEGSLAVNEGRLILPTARFRIVPPGAITLRYPIQGDYGLPTMGINVDLKADTFLTAASMSGVRKRYRVTVTARGPLTGNTAEEFTGESRLALSFQTDPPDLAGDPRVLTRKVVGILTGEEYFNKVGQNPEQAFAGLLTNALTSSVFPELFENFATSLGFEEFAINYDPVERLNLSVSRHLFGPLYASYIRSLNADKEMYELKFSLRFRDRYQLSYSDNDQHTQQILLEGVWQF